VDGTILINQSTVMAAGGFPYVITQPGSYKLTGNLVVPADTYGIKIEANNVTLDLNGFGIGGAIDCHYSTNACAPAPVSYTAAGIYADSPRVSIRNGHVHGFPVGVRMFGGLIEDVRVSDNWYFGIQAQNSILRHLDVETNSQVGIQASNCLTMENTILDNGTKQIDAFGGGVFSHNVIHWYLSNGISVSSSVVNEHNSSCLYSGSYYAC